MKLFRRTGLKRKVLAGLFLYTMTFGYIYTYLMQYKVNDDENLKFLRINYISSISPYKIKKATSIQTSTLIPKGHKVQLTEVPKKAVEKVPKKPVEKVPKQPVEKVPKQHGKESPKQSNRVVQNQPMKEASKKPESKVAEKPAIEIPDKPANEVPKQSIKKLTKQSPKRVQRPLNPLKKSYKREFKYPLEIDFKKLIYSLESGNETGLPLPINPHPYHTLYSPVHSCEFNNDSAHPKVLILVKSAVQNSERRTTIRNTWGSTNSSRIHLLFMLGLPTDGNLVVRTEHSKYGDILQEDFIDNYRNNTIKMIMAFKWAVTNCLSVDYLFFVDDDYFVNIRNLITNVESKKLKDTKFVFSGTLLSHSVPYRDQGSKWFIPWEDYPFDLWPPYIAGGAYFVSMHAARKFSLAFPYVKPIHIDDVYLGIVAKKVGINPTSNRNIGYRKVPKSSLMGLIASHGYSSKQDVETAWSYLNVKLKTNKQKVPKH